MGLEGSVKMIMLCKEIKARGVPVSQWREFKHQKCQGGTLHPVAMHAEELLLILVV